MEKEDVANLLYIIWVSLTIICLGARVPFQIMPTDIANIPVFLGSLYHMIILVAVGSVLPVGKRFGGIFQAFRLIPSLIATAMGAVVLYRNDLTLGILGIISGISGLIWAVYDYWRSERAKK